VKKLTPSSATFIWFLLWVLMAGPVFGNNRTVLLATTTSTDNSGLLQYLIPHIEEDTKFEFKVIAVGTGKALRMGERGDVDVLLVHAVESELEFINAGYGVNRMLIMYNDFVIVGPDADPANIRELNSIAEVLNAIINTRSRFISRGDDSGTHKKERMLWDSSTLNPQGSWYLEVGQGMGKTLQIADELRGYTLVDRGTWLFAKQNLDLELLFAGEHHLLNQYSVIAVNPDKHDVNFDGAQALSNWLVSDKGQRLINNYLIDGEQLFYGNTE